MKKCIVAALAALAPALALSQILIGQTAGFTGVVAAGVKETTDGARAASAATMHFFMFVSSGRARPRT